MVWSHSHDPAYRHKVLVIEPHSDDGFLGLGGYMLKYADRCDFAMLLISAGDILFADGRYIDAAVRVAEFKAYTERFGRQVGVPLAAESRLDTVPQVELVQMIEQALAVTQPDTVFIPSPSFHQDHRAVYTACVAAFRPSVRTLPQQVLMYENAGLYYDQIFRPNLYCVLDATILSQKVTLFQELFPSQVRPGTYVSNEAIVDIATYRGFERNLGYAEAFQTLVARI